MTNTLCKGACIYALYDGNQLVYIGESMNVYSRIGRHVNDGKKMFNNFSIFFMPKMSLKKLEGLEAHLILHYRPKYNTQYNTSKFFGKQVYCNTKEEYESSIQNQIRRWCKLEKKKRMEEYEILKGKCETYYQQERRKNHADTSNQS